MHEGVIPYTDHCTPCEHLAVRVSDGWDKLPNLIPVAGPISHVHTFREGKKKKGRRNAPVRSRVVASYKTLICKILNKLLPREVNFTRVCVTRRMRTFICRTRGLR